MFCLLHMSIYKERLAIKQRFLSAKKSQRYETTVKEFLENLQSYPKHNTVLQYNPFRKLFTSKMIKYFSTFSLTWLECKLKIKN